MGKPRKRDVKLVTLDTETYGLSGDIRRIAIYDGKEVYYGYSFSDVEPYLINWDKEGYQVHIYIHNMDFDLRKMPEIFRKSNVNWNSTILIHNRYVKLKCKHYTIHDSFRLLPMSLDYISGEKGFNVEHGKMDLWTEVQKRYPEQYESKDDFFKNVPADDPLYLEYLGYDVISLYEVLEALVEISGLTAREFVDRITTANLSKYIFRKGWNGIPFIHEGQKKTDFELITSMYCWNNEDPRQELGGKSYYDLEKIIRDGYYGGRTEVFRPRLWPHYEQAVGYHYDINSLYPFEMMKEFPIGFPEFYEDEAAHTQWKLWILDHKGLGFITAQVDVPKQFVPPLPCKKGKLAFVTGKQRGTWTLTELEYAVMECNVTVTKVENVILFPKTFRVFENFVNTFYPLKVEGKKTGNKALTFFCKLILNVGYGYLALKRDRTDVKNNTAEQKEKFADKLIFENEDLGYIMVENFIESETVQVAIAAHVTSYARLDLLRMLRHAEETGEIYYCDTDSIVSSKPFPADVIHPTDLGKWDLEGVLKEGIFLQPKVYSERKTTDDVTVKFKGVGTDTQKSFKFDFYLDLYDLYRQNTETEIVVEPSKEMLRSLSYAQKMGIDWNTVEVRDKKMYLDAIQKRTIDFESNITTPIHCNTLHDFEVLDMSLKHGRNIDVNFTD